MFSRKVVLLSCWKVKIKVELLKSRVKENNEKYGLNIELVTNNADGVPGFAKLFFAKGVNNFFILAGPESADLD